MSYLTSNGLQHFALLINGHAIASVLNISDIVAISWRHKKGRYVAVIIDQEHKVVTPAPGLVSAFVSEVEHIASWADVADE